MNKKARSRIAGATTLIAISLGSAACGTATAPATDIDGQPGAFTNSGAKHPNGGSSADSAERRGKAEADARKAEARRAAQGRQQHEKKLGSTLP
jgi:hypothetical protein